jgi:hypothetical protein
VFLGRIARVKYQKWRRAKKARTDGETKTENKPEETGSPESTSPMNEEGVVAVEETSAPAIDQDTPVEATTSIEETKEERVMSAYDVVSSHKKPEHTDKKLEFADAVDKTEDDKEIELDDAEDWTTGFQHRRTMTMFAFEKAIRKPAEEPKKALHSRTRNLTLNFEQEFNLDDIMKEVDEKPEEQPKKNYFKMFINYFAEWIGWPKMRWYQRVFFVAFDWITILIRNLTIPKSDTKEWSRVFACMVPMFAPLVVLLTAGYQCALLILILT